MDQLRFCPRCGADREPPDALFCARCGSPYGSVARGHWASPEDRRGGSRFGQAVSQGFGWGCGCLLLIIAIPLILYLIAQAGH